MHTHDEYGELFVRYQKLQRDQMAVMRRNNELNARVRRLEEMQTAANTTIDTLIEANRELVAENKQIKADYFERFKAPWDRPSAQPVLARIREDMGQTTF